MAKHIMKLNKEYSGVSGVRVQDLVSKVAHVSARQTARVLKALDLVCFELGVEPSEVIAAPAEVTAPSAHEAALCDEAHQLLDDNLFARLKEDEPHPFRAIREL